MMSGELLERLEERMGETSPSSLRFRVEAGRS
jgi:hypothetical protein